jgi:hypothetical protein
MAFVDVVSSRAKIIEQLQIMEENQGKTIVSNAKLSGGRKAVYKCDSPGCMYAEVFCKHLITSLPQSQNNNGDNSRANAAAVVSGAENQHVSQHRTIVDSWWKRNKILYIPHGQRGGIPCTGAGTNGRRASLIDQTGILAQNVAYQYSHQSDGSKKKQNVALIQKLLLTQERPLIVSKNQIKSATRALKQKLIAEENEEISDLLPFLKCAGKLNPEMHSKVEKSENHELLRFCLLMPYAKELFGKFAYKIVAMDGSHMKNIPATTTSSGDKRKRSDHDSATIAVDVGDVISASLSCTSQIQPMVLVLLCGIGPNDTRFIYGFGMFITENATDMTWMLKLFRKWGLDLDVTGTVITSDRGAAIGKTYEDCFNNAVHIYCGVHLKRNLKEHGNNEYKHAVL